MSPRRPDFVWPRMSPGEVTRRLVAMRDASPHPQEKADLDYAIACVRDGNTAAARITLLGLGIEEPHRGRMDGVA